MRDTHRFPRLVLVEGLPGLGKTTLAEGLCARLERLGCPARWVREEAKDHPVIDAQLRRSAPEPDYAERCTRRWDAFAAALETSSDPHTWVLEGCYFQSVVRFLLEQDRPAEQARTYVAETGRRLQALPSRLVYLTRPDPERYLRAELAARKGADVVARIAAYTAATPWARRRGLEGEAALVGLYAAYRAQCDLWFRASPLPGVAIETEGRDANAVLEAVLRGLEGEREGA